jgi:hypothetical protein
LKLGFAVAFRPISGLAFMHIFVCFAKICSTHGNFGFAYIAFGLSNFARVSGCGLKMEFLDLSQCAQALSQLILN